MKINILTVKHMNLAKAFICLRLHRFDIKSIINYLITQTFSNQSRWQITFIIH